jgi:hypothetical protein
MLATVSKIVPFLNISLPIGKINMKYAVLRKLQEQSGSYFVHLPKVWVQAQGLKESDLMIVRFKDGLVQITPARKGAA